MGTPVDVATARDLAEQLLEPLGRRWLHVQGVVRADGKIYIASGAAGPGGTEVSNSRRLFVAKPGQTARSFANLLAYELKPGREELLELLRAGRTRRELRALGHGLEA